MQTKLPPSDSFLSSGAFDIDMPLLPSSKMTNERLYPIPHNPLSGSSIASSSSLPLSQPPTSSSPSLPLRSPVPFSPRHALPNFTFPPIVSTSSLRVPQPRSSSGHLSGHSPGNDSGYRNSISPAPSTLAAATATTTTALDHPSIGHDGPASSHLIQRLTQQNTLIRDAWEAERIYLEANRRRAEEVYQEERAIMEDLRDGWYNEKADLLGAMQLLRERVQRLEGENSALKAMVSQSMAQVTGVLSPLASQRGDSVDGSSEHSPSSALRAAHSGADSGAAVGLGGVVVAPPFSEQALLLHNHSNLLAAGATATSTSASASTSSLPPGLDGASRRPHFASPPRPNPGLSSASPPAILDPRTQPESSVMHDFLGSSSSEEAESPVAIIDVQEIDPKLEGISLRATAVQKPTFTEETARSPRAASPPAATTSVSQHDESVRSLMRKHGSSKAHTMQVLAAGEARRLTMHAGHTPSHSLSLFPTMTTATGASSVVTHSGGTTPTGVASSPPKSCEEAAEHPISAGDDGVDKTYDEEEAALRGDNGDEDPEEFPLLASDEPAALRGPLMVKNIPAQDELFWAAVNKKLEPISQGQDALPTVVQTPVGQISATWAGVIPVGGDATRDADGRNSNNINTDDDDDDNGEMEAGGVGGRESAQEHDVPLRLRTTTNFGAPFGMM